MQYALMEGVKYAWWKKALRGSTLRQLHETWAHGQSVLEASRAGKNFSAVALGRIVTSVACIAVPLLQHATSVATVPTARDIVVSASLSPEPFPSGFSANGTGPEPIPTYQFSQVVRGYKTRKEIDLDYTGCEGVCSTSFDGPGFDIACSSTTSSYDFVTETVNNTNTTTFFAGGANFSFNPARDSSTFNITVSYKPSPSCIGDLAVTTCVLRAAIVNYPVSLQNGTTTLLPSAHNDTIALQSPPPSDPQTLQGFVTALHDLFHSTINLTHTPSASPPWTIASTGPIAYTHALPPTTPDCTLTWSNPIPDILSAARALAFRSAIAVSSDAAQRAPARQTAARTAYVSHPRFLAAAMVVMLVDAAAVLPLFVGWWRLGRRVSLSPLEVARAFRAPLLEGVEGGGEARDVVREVGGVRVRYGVLARGSGRRGGADGGVVGWGGEGGRREKMVGRTGLGMVEQEVSFGELRDVSGIFEEGGRRGSLGFGDEDETGRPEKGVAYR
ncbi:uncharacterized protein K452DRAFT_252088 [Neofusicoccum parvum]|uniref:Uncharacterized protein K452DRAFT_252088, partial n=1 Tax=Neofusicoccum parvum TaxID=310453 RepID=A0ACB5S612_9PEZI|nr:uncharacterized protein K452DRAFT_252088 [Neofusicoccum parvum]